MWCLQDIWAKSYLQNLAGQLKLMCRPDKSAPESQLGHVMVMPLPLITVLRAILLVKEWPVYPSKAISREMCVGAAC